MASYIDKLNITKIERDRVFVFFILYINRLI